MISKILFDVGGVIISPLNPEETDVARLALAEQLGFPDLSAMWQRFYTGPEWWAAKTGEMTYQEMWRLILPEYGLTSKAEQAAFLTDLFADEGVLPTMRQLIKTLHGRYPLAILSNASDDLLERLAFFNVADYFDPIINSYDVGIPKPQTAVYELTVDRLGVPAEEVFFIDNFAHNIRAAEDVGMVGHVFTSVEGLQADLTTRGIL